MKVLAVVVLVGLICQGFVPGTLCLQDSAPASVQFLHQAVSVNTVDLDVVFEVPPVNGSNGYNVTLFKGIAYGILTFFASIPSEVRFDFTLLDSKTHAVVANLGAVTFTPGSTLSLMAYSICAEHNGSPLNCTYTISYIPLPINKTQPEEYGYDQAKVTFVNLSSRLRSLQIWGIDTNCVDCLYLPLTTLNVTSPYVPLIIETHHDFEFDIRIPRNARLVIVDYMWLLLGVVKGRQDSCCSETF